MTPAEASAMEGVDGIRPTVDGTKGDDNIMDWEIADEQDKVHHDLASQTVVDNFLLEEPRVREEDFDMETFSFESDDDDDEEEEANKPCSPELGTMLKIKVLQNAIEASADALDIVTGKDVVMIAGKTGELVGTYVWLCHLNFPCNKLTPVLSVTCNRCGEINADSRHRWKAYPCYRAQDYLLW